jgi:hypothetical protein
MLTPVQRKRKNSEGADSPYPDILTSSNLPKNFFDPIKSIPEQEESSEPSQIFQQPTFEIPEDSKSSINPDEFFLIQQIELSIEKKTPLNLKRLLDYPSGKEIIYSNGIREHKHTLQDSFEAIKRKSIDGILVKPFRWSRSPIGSQSKKTYRTRRNLTEEESCSDIQLKKLEELFK